MVTGVDGRALAWRQGGSSDWGSSAGGVCVCVIPPPSLVWVSRTGSYLCKTCAAASSESHHVIQCFFIQHQNSVLVRRATGSRPVGAEATWASYGWPGRADGRARLGAGWAGAETGAGELITPCRRPKISGIQPGPSHRRTSTLIFVPTRYSPRTLVHLSNQSHSSHSTATQHPIISTGTLQN